MQHTATFLKVLLVGILALSSAGRGVISAGTNVWTSNGPEGGTINALAIDPSAPATLYAGTHENGVFKSTDGGANWSPVNTGLTNSFILSLAIDPGTPATVYAGALVGMFKSTDGGANWSLTNTGLTSSFIRALAIDPGTPATVYAGTYDGVFKSTDGGANWSLTSSGLADAVRALVIDSSAPATLYAGTNSAGVFKSTDGGANWSSANTGLTNSFILSLAIDPLAPSTLYVGTYGGVFKSTDGGGSWSPASTGLTSSIVRALAIDPGTPATLYAGTDGGGMFKSTDGGANWSPANTGLASPSVISLAINPSAPGTVYAGTDGYGVSKSTDGGGNWSTFNAGLMAAAVYALAIDPGTPATLYGGADGGGVSKSTDGGGSWNATNTGLTSLSVDALALHPSAPTTLYAGTYGGGVFKSTDGGANWSPANTGLTKLDVLALAIDPGTPATLYVGTDGGGVFKSTDGGANWNPANTGLTHSAIDLAIDPLTPATLYAGTYGGGLFKSTDGAGSWSSVNTGLTNSIVNALAIDSVTPATLYAGTDGGGVFKSTDGGANWNPANTGLTNPVVRALAIDPVTPATLYAGTWGGGVFKSTDGAGSWSALNAGLTATRVNVLAIGPVTPATLHAGTYGGGVFDMQQMEQVVFVGFDVTAAVVAENAGSASLTVALSAAAAVPVTVDYDVSGGTATGGGVDYALVAGSLTLDPGETTGAIVVTIVDDVEDEPDETVVVTLSNPQNATLTAKSSTTLTIEDNDLDTTPPDPPVLLSPPDGTTTSDDTPALVWQPSPSFDVAGYTVDLSGTVTDVGNVTQYDVVSPLATGTYTWTVASYDAVGNNSPYTDTWSFTVDTDPPDPPTLLSPPDGTTTGDDTPALVWQPSPSIDVAGYMVNLSGTVTDVGNATQYDVTPPLASGTYTWTVAAYDLAANSSPYPDSWSLTVDATPPEPPTLLSPANGSTSDDNTPTLAWQTSPSPDVAGYFLHLDGTFTDVGNSTQHTTSILPDGTHTWTVTSYDTVGNNSPFTDTWSFTVDTTAPDPPVLLSPPDGTTTSDDTPALVWQPSPSADAAGYTVDLSGTITDVGNVTQYDITSPLATGTYTWTVAAYDAVSLASAYPGAWSFTVDPTHTPQVVEIQPTANSHTATVAANLVVTVNDIVSPTTVTTRTLFVHGGFRGHLGGGFHFSDIVFNPDNDFHPGERIDVSVTDGVEAGKKRITPYVWQFRSGVGGGDGQFTSGQHLRGVGFNEDLALGDLDGNGGLDVVLARGTGYPSLVCLNDGTGTFGPACSSLSSANSNAVALGDLDGDGDLDIFLANGDVSAGKSEANEVWLNQSGTQGGTPGTFALAWTQSSDLSISYSVALGDLDGDGDLDAFIGTDHNQASRVWTNEGAGTFSAGWVEGSAPSDLAASRDLALGDLDGDGDLDVFEGTVGLNRVWVNEGGNQGGAMGTFQPGWKQPSDGVTTRGVALGDLDADGNLDALTANAVSADVIWRNDGYGSFSRTALSPQSLDSWDVALGDLDGDGDLDAFVSNWWTDPDQVWRNDGNLAFTNVQGLDPDIPLQDARFSSLGVALGDLDGDGDLDAAVATNGNLKVWHNQDATIPSSGGTVAPAPGVTITVPGGAFTDAVVLHYTPHPITSTGSLQHVGLFYELDCTYLSSGELASLQPGQRYTITVTYNQDDVPPGVNEADLALYYLDDHGRWTKEPTSIVDTVANTITATPDHFSLWGALESKYVVYLPLVVRSN